MTVTLSPKQQAFVDEQVAAGRYPDVDAVLAEALKVLEQREDEAKTAALTAKFDEAEAQVAAGMLIRNPVSAKEKLVAIRRRLGGE
jgi:putative addiction module CopG family antidote